MRICPKCAQKGTEPFCGRDGTPTLRVVDYHPGTPGLVGKIVGDRYRLLSILGEGGMGCVWFGEHLRLRQPVAIKVIHEANSRDQQQRIRFEREALAMSRVQHQNVVRVYDFGFEDGIGPYLAMEYLEGIDLRRTLKTLGALSPNQIVHIACQVAAALVAAHDAGLVHRDLKPANIFVVESGGTSNFIKVLDFGIAKSLHQLSDERPKSLTNTGVIVGTPFYMAPEQASGMTSRSADLYALGVILHQCLTGKRPFTGTSPVEVIMQHMNAAPPPLGKNVPERLRKLVEGLMAKQPTDRPRNAQAVLEALQQIGNGHLRSDTHDTVVDVTLNVANIETSDVPQVNPHNTGHLSEMTPVVSKTVSSLKDPNATTQALTPEETVTTRPARIKRLQGLWIPAGLVLIAIATTSFTIHRIREHRSPDKAELRLEKIALKAPEGELVNKDLNSTPKDKALPAAIPIAPAVPESVEAAAANSSPVPEPNNSPVRLHKLSVFTLPPNAQVQIRPAQKDAEWSEPLRSPLEIKVEEGTYEIRLKKADYKVRRMKLDVSSERKVHLKLRPDLGDL